MAFEWKLFMFIVIILIFQYEANRLLKIVPKIKSFGPFLRLPFHHVDESTIKIVDIGILPEIFTKTRRIFEHDIELVELPIGTTLYKAMKIPSSGIPNQTDILNTYANKNSWLTNLNAAKEYMNSSFGDIVSFEVIQNLKLFDISVKSNWDIIWSKMNDQLKKLLETNIPLDVSLYARKYIQEKIDKILFQQKIIQLTIGYEITWKEQQKLLLEFGDAITNRYTYHPRDEIKKRKSHFNDWFSIDEKPIVLKSNKNTYGWRKKDLKRLSFVAALDNIMVDTITEYTNVDGYYSGRFPSLFHTNGYLLEEIAIHVPRDKLIVLNIKCQKDFYPCRSTCYNPDEEECLPGGILQRS